MSTLLSSGNYVIYPLGAGTHWTYMGGVYVLINDTDDKIIKAYDGKLFIICETRTLSGNVNTTSNFAKFNNTISL